MMDQVCNEIKRVLLAGVGLADKGIQKVGQGVNSLSSLSPEQLDALRSALNAQPPEAPEQPQNDENS